MPWRHSHQLGADVNVIGGSVTPWNPLTYASIGGHLDVVELLLANNADVHPHNDNALQCASQSGHTAVVRLLIQRGADMHARDNRAILNASLNGHTDVVQLPRRKPRLNAKPPKLSSRTSPVASLSVIRACTSQPQDSPCTRCSIISPRPVLPAQQQTASFLVSSPPPHQPLPLPPLYHLHPHHHFSPITAH